MVIFLRFLYVYLRVLCKRRDITKGNPWKIWAQIGMLWIYTQIHPGESGQFTTRLGSQIEPMLVDDSPPGSNRTPHPARGSPVAPGTTAAGWKPWHKSGMSGSPRGADGLWPRQKAGFLPKWLRQKRHVFHVLGPVFGEVPGFDGFFPFIHNSIGSTK